MGGPIPTPGGMSNVNRLHGRGQQENVVVEEENNRGDAAEHAGRGTMGEPKETAEGGGVEVGRD